MNGATYLNQEPNDHIFVAQSKAGEHSGLWLSGVARINVRHDRSGLAWVQAVRRELFAIEQRIEAGLQSESDRAERQAAREVNCAQASDNAQPFGSLDPASTTISRLDVTRAICAHAECEDTDDGGEAA